MSEREIFLVAVDLPAGARTVYLDKVCGTDAVMRSRVEALLRSHQAAGSFLGTPAVAPHEPDSAATCTIGPRSDAAADDEVPLGFLAPASRPDALGRIGHYEVLQVLGQGGFGIVFRAFDDVLQRVVAVKVLSPQLATTSPSRKRFLREARSSAQVRHENVVQTYEVGETPLPYIAMEFIPGETLQQRLDRVGPVDAAEVVRIGRQIAEGLATAHATDLIHRDIKPSNVLLEGGVQRVKITDFGLARAADDASISQSGIIAGTPMYMAPEQAKGETLDQRADLFSLGSVLYQMASGRSPFRATGTLAVLKRVAEDTPRSIREITPETPPWLCAIIAKLHAKNPDERYQTAREVADVLADCEAQLKAHSKLKDFSRIPRSKQPATGKSGRWKWTAAAALVLPVLAMAVTAFAGVTHLFRQQVTRDPIGAGGETMPVVVAKKETPSLPTVEAKKETLSLPTDAVLVMNFAKDTFYDKEGQTYVRDLSGHGNDGLCENVAFTADGKVGGGLLCQHGQDLPAYAGGLRIGKSLIITGQPNYTVIAWCRRVKAGPMRLYHACPATHAFPQPELSPHFAIGRFLTRSFEVSAYNGALTARECWRHAQIDLAAIHDRDWFFVAVALSDGAIGQGQLRVFIDDQRRGFASQMAAGNQSTKEFVDLVGYNTSGAVIDELAVFQRALSDQEIMAVRALGLNATPFGPGNLVPLARDAAKQEPLPPTFTNRIGMEFVIVPKGKAWLGGGKDKLGDQEQEIPADFYLGKYAVTQEEWEKVMGANPSHFARTGGGADAVKDIADADLKRFPVESVSWEDCQVFVAKLNPRENESGWHYRLPKSAEWEYACRGGASPRAASAFDFYFDEPTNDLSSEQANFNGDSPAGNAAKGKYLERTCKVGAYRPNRLGLYDMHGNVWQWCEDAFAGGPDRVIRGGGAHGVARDCFAWESTRRSPPTFQDHNHGLRLARVPPALLRPK